jgi:hypothetical protein
MPDDEPRPAGEADSEDGEDEEPPIPESDVTGEAVWATGLKPDELAEVVVEGPDVGQRSINIPLAITVLDRFQKLARSFAGSVGLPMQLSFTRLEWGHSAVFGFATGPDSYKLADSGEVSGMDEAIEQLRALIEVSASDDELLLRARELPEVVAKNYIAFLAGLQKHEASAEIRTRRRTSAKIEPPVAARAKMVLQREAPPETEVRNVVGYLYEANAKRNGFELAPEDGSGTIKGSFDEELSELIRAAWKKRVVAKIRFTRRRLERSTKPFKVDTELIDILETTEPDKSLLG